MIKKIHINDSDEATFVCPNCDKTKTVDVSKYINVNSRTQVKSTCRCGCSWTSILERRKRYRMAVNIPCICNHMGARGSSESIPMRIADLSSNGLKIKPIKNGTIKTTDYFIDDPIIVDFHLEDNDKTHLKKTAYAKNISENHIGAQFDGSKHGDHIIGFYILGQVR